MDVSVATWHTLSRLLDEALDFEPAARAAWFKQVAATRPELAPVLRKLLSAHATAEGAGLLAGRASPASAADPFERAGDELGLGGVVGKYRVQAPLLLLEHLVLARLLGAHGEPDDAHAGFAPARALLRAPTAPSASRFRE